MAVLASAGLAASIAVASAGTASADDPPGPGTQIGTEATVGSGNGGGSSGNLKILCSWALEDADGNWYENEAQADGVMDYGIGGDSTPTYGPYNTDDGIYATDQGPVEEAPCTNNPLDIYQPPTQSNTAGPIHIDVKANANDKPEEQFVEVWSLVDLANAPSAAYTPTFWWEVYHPDGTYKFQVPGRVYNRCDGPPGMLFKAITSGQISWHTADFDPATFSLESICQQLQGVLVYGAFPISKHQAWGKYTIEAHASDNLGNLAAPQSYHINSMRFHHMFTDVSTIKWSSAIIPGQHMVQPGNFAFEGIEAQSQYTYPTVANFGNSGSSLEVKFDVMCKQRPASQGGGNDPQCQSTQESVRKAKTIDEFDAHFGVDHDTLVYVGTEPEYLPSDATIGLEGTDPIPPNDWVDFAVQDGEQARGKILPFQTLCPNDRGKLGLSLYARPTIEIGDYKGGIKLRLFDVTDINGYDLAYGAAPNPTIVNPVMADDYDGGDNNPNVADSVCESDKGGVYLGNHDQWRDNGSWWNAYNPTTSRNKIKPVHTWGGFAAPA